MASIRRLWTHDEAMLAFRLYCEIPFGQMHRGNPAVVRLATQIGRTPSAVALKLVNFAHLDPALQQRGIRGMSNVSQQDREIARAFGLDWEASVQTTASASISGVEDECQPTYRQKRWFRLALVSRKGSFDALYSLLMISSAALVGLRRLHCSRQVTSSRGP